MYFLEQINECKTEELKQLYTFVNGLLNLIKIAVPILLVVMGSLDLGKAVMAGADKEIKEAQGLLVKRLISAVFVFFIGTLVAVIMGLVVPGWKSCIG